MREVRTSLIAGVVLVIVAISILPTGAAASTTGWWYMHGTAANVENFAGIVNAVRIPTGYSLTVAPTAPAFVEIAIPTHFQSNVAVNRIFVDFKTDSPLMLVNAIEVWNGTLLVWSTIGPWNGTTTLTLPLPAKLKFNRGLMLRFLTQNTDPVNNHQFDLSTAGAKFVRYP